MLILHKRIIRLVIIFLVLFFYPPVTGITNNSITTSDIPEENTEAIEAEIYSAFDAFRGAEEMINRSDSVKVEQLNKYFPEIKIDIQKEPLIWVNLNSGKKVWILPSFYWGCLFGSVGVLVTGIVSKWQNGYLTDSTAGMILNCNVLADVAIIAYTIYLLKIILETMASSIDNVSNGCNAW